MRQFYCAFPIRHTLCDELSWSHYRLLMRLEDEKARKFYLEESVKSGWSVRQLERQIGTFYYERLLASQDRKEKSQINYRRKSICDILYANQVSYDDRAYVRFEI